MDVAWASKAASPMQVSARCVLYIYLSIYLSVSIYISVYILQVYACCVKTRKRFFVFLCVSVCFCVFLRVFSHEWAWLQSSGVGVLLFNAWHAPINSRIKSRMPPLLGRANVAKPLCCGGRCWQRLYAHRTLLRADPTSSKEASVPKQKGKKKQAKTMTADELSKVNEDSAEAAASVAPSLLACWALVPSVPSHVNPCQAAPCAHHALVLCFPAFAFLVQVHTY